MSRSLLGLVALVVLAVASMVLYAAAGRRSDRDAERRGTQFLLGAGNFLVHWLMWLLTPLDRLALRLGLTPDLFNLAGLLAGAASGWLIASGRLAPGGWAIAVGGLCDVMDGRVARARGIASEYGKFIDATLDRFVESFVLLGFVVYLEPFSLGPLAAATALSGSLLVSYSRARGETVGVLCREGLMQRAERLVLLALVCLADAPLSAAAGARRGSAAFFVVCALAVLTLLTAVRRTLWIARRLRAKERGEG
jgi:phosphatidylinositol phosphate synthase